MRLHTHQKNNEPCKFWMYTKHSIYIFTDKAYIDKRHINHEEELIGDTGVNNVNMK